MLPFVVFALTAQVCALCCLCSLLFLLSQPRSVLSCLCFMCFLSSIECLCVCVCMSVLSCVHAFHVCMHNRRRSQAVSSLLYRSSMQPTSSWLQSGSPMLLCVTFLSAAYFAPGSQVTQ